MTTLEDALSWRFHAWKHAGKTLRWVLENDPTFLKLFVAFNPSFSAASLVHNAKLYGL